MKPRRLLYLTSGRMDAFLWSAGIPVPEGSYSSADDGLPEFRNYLERNIDSVFSLLVDVAEEDIHVETIPFLQGADRNAVIARKLGQTFFSSGLTASQSLGYRKTERKEERVMLFALTNGNFLSPWLAVLGQTKIALSGIYSPLLLAPKLLKKNRLTDENCLLLTIQNRSLRQIYFEKGELRFSRLTVIKDDSVSGVTRAIAEETVKLQQYVNNQARQYETSQQPIAAYIFSRKRYFDMIREVCADTYAIRFNLIDIDNCFQRAGLKQSPPVFHGEWIFLGLMATSPSSIQFATDSLRHNHFLELAKTTLYSVGLTILAACLLVSGKFLYDRSALMFEAQSLETAARISRGYYEAIIKTFPQVPASGEALRRVIGHYIDLAKKSVSPEGLYVQISRAIQGAPSIEIDTIHWKVGLTDPEPANMTPVANALRVPEGSESAIVLGTIHLGANAHPRQVLGVFNRFAGALESAPKTRVEILKRPFDIEPEKTLKGNEIALEDDKPSTFIVQILREIGP